MEDRLKSISLMTTLLLLTGIFACSDSGNSNNKQNVNTKQNQSITASINKTICNRPLDVYLSTTTFQSKGQYQLTYSWNNADNATGYEFELLLNGVTAFQNLSVTDTFITFTQTISATDSMVATVRTVCNTVKSASSKESSSIVYLNSVATDDIIFFVEPTTTVDDICARNCQKLKFNSSSLLNSNGTVITLANFSMEVPYYDFDAVKNCIQCTGSTAPVINPVEFNSCLNSPLNQYWLYDPGSYTVCP